MSNLSFHSKEDMEANAIRRNDIKRLAMDLFVAGCSVSDIDVSTEMIARKSIEFANIFFNELDKGEESE